MKVINTIDEFEIELKECISNLHEISFLNEVFLRNNLDESIVWRFRYTRNKKNENLKLILLFRIFLIWCLGFRILIFRFFYHFGVWGFVH